VSVSQPVGSFNNITNFSANLKILIVEYWLYGKWRKHYLKNVAYETFVLDSYYKVTQVSINLIPSATLLISSGTHRSRGWPLRAVAAPRAAVLITVRFSSTLITSPRCLPHMILSNTLIGVDDTLIALFETVRCPSRLLKFSCFSSSVSRKCWNIISTYATSVPSTTFINHHTIRGCVLYAMAVLQNKAQRHTFFDSSNRRTIS